MVNKTKKRGIPPKKKSKIKRFIMFFLMTALFTVISLCVLMISYIKTHIETSADISEYYRACGENITEFFYYNGAEGENAVKLSDSDIYSTEKRLFAPYETIPQDLINAFIAIEDKRFYEHNGVDWYRTLGATLNYVFKFRDSFGASTITQQLVKNVTGNDSYSIKRKLQEIFYAQSIEKQLDKKDILELYLNIVNLSQGCLGVRTAALVYFSKELSELDLGECACLAAITQNPSYYDPCSNPDNNMKRRQVILDEMLSLGYINEEEHSEYYNKEISLKMNDRFKTDRINSWYIDMVIDDVCTDLCHEYGYSYDEAESLVYTGGLKIYTLMDPEIQQIVEEYYENQNNFPDAANAIKAQSSIIIIDPYTGNVLGVAGGRGQKNANRIQNYATQTLRPSGSVIKPLSVYAPALENGMITYASVFDDVPVNFGTYNLDPDQGEIISPKPWPVNAPNVYHGLVNVNYAVEVSLNTVAVKVLELLGKEDSFYFLKETLGIGNLIEELTLENGTVLTDMDIAALALGQMNYGVTVREVTSAYTIFTNEGQSCKSRSYSVVTDSDGKTILRNDPSENYAISGDNAVIINQMLQNVVDHGTAKYITLDESVPVAGKTGTSQDYHDRWFIGYTPYYLGGVWYGYEYPKSLDNNTQYICTKIWNDIMLKIHSKYDGEEKRFSTSDDVIWVNYCCDSGKLISEACLLDPRGIRAERGCFVKGTEPTEKCDCHVLVEYDSYTHGIATDGCPQENIVTVGLIQADRHFPMQVYVTDAQYVWKKIKKGVPPSMSSNHPFFFTVIPKNEFWGISNAENQFNCICSEHYYVKDSN